MSHVLMLQSSGGVLALGIGAGDRVIFDSSGDTALAQARDIDGALRKGLAETGLRLGDLDRIGVDIGPGGLGATRTAAAFANALGFALGVPVIGLPAFALLGFHGARATGRPVLIARRAARPHLFLGRYTDRLERFDYVTEDDAQAAIDAESGPFTLAGNMRFQHGGTLREPLTNAAPLTDMLALMRSPAYLERNDASAVPITEDL